MVCNIMSFLFSTVFTFFSSCTFIFNFFLNSHPFPLSCIISTPFYCDSEIRRIRIRKIYKDILSIWINYYHLTAIKNIIRLTEFMGKKIIFISFRIKVKTDIYNIYLLVKGRIRIQLSGRVGSGSSMYWLDCSYPEAVVDPDVLAPSNKIWIRNFSRHSIFSIV